MDLIADKKHLKYKHKPLKQFNSNINFNNERAKELHMLNYGKLPRDKYRKKILMMDSEYG